MKEERSNFYLKLCFHSLWWIFWAAQLWSSNHFSSSGLVWLWPERNSSSTRGLGRMSRCLLQPHDPRISCRPMFPSASKEAYRDQSSPLRAADLSQKQRDFSCTLRHFVQMYWITFKHHIYLYACVGCWAMTEINNLTGLKSDFSCLSFLIPAV